LKKRCFPLLQDALFDEKPFDLEHARGDLSPMNEFETGDGDLWQQFLTRSIHDMRTPLSSMRVALEVMRVTGDDAEARRKLLGILNSNVDELAEMLEIFLKELPGFGPPSFAKVDRD
jgi:hypothetical protein